MAAPAGNPLRTVPTEKGRGIVAPTNANLTVCEPQEVTMPSSLLYAASVYETLHEFVSAYKLHPILVNFTAALVPVSVGSDILGRIFGKQTLRDTGWWTCCFAAVITPFTAIAG